MFYQESDILVVNQNFIEEDVAAVDEYLFKNQGNAVRVARASDFTDVDQHQMQSILDKYVVAGVVSPASLAVCGRDDVLIEEPDDNGNYFCDICEETYPADKLAFETVYIPRVTQFECGDTIPIARKGVPDVDGIEKIIGCSNADRVADVVFVHGLDGDAKSTWHPKDRPDDFFPKWLGEEFPNVGVWTLGYKASSSGWKGTTMPLFDRATNVLATLETASFGKRPLIFIAHSMGGLVVKQVLRTAIDSGKPNWRAISNSTKSIMFLATPHSGSNIANYVKYLGNIYRTTVTVEELESHAPALRDLNMWFCNCGEIEIQIEVLFEKETTYGFLVVDETSANPGIQGVVPIAMDTDHGTICKPESKSDLVFGRARLAVQNVLDAQ